MTIRGQQNGFRVIKKRRRKKRRPKQYEVIKRRCKKDILTQICRRAEITGRFAKRFSGERPDPLGFEFSLFAEIKRVVRRVLDLRRVASHLL